MTLWQLTLLVLYVIGEVLCQQAPNDFTAQYHIQTDLGTNRFFRFQTHSGQYRKEKRNPDGSVEGTYGWVDPNGVLRLYDYIADHLGYRIEKEYLYQVGPPSPLGIIATRGGDLNFGFEVYPLDGDIPDRQSGGVALRVNLPEKDFGAALPYRVSSLTSTNDYLNPNPVSLQAQATFFSGEPAAPPPAPRVVIGATDVLEPRSEAEPAITVVGHTGRTLPAPEQPARHTGIVIGLSHNDEAVSSARGFEANPPPPPPPASRTSNRRQGIVIGSSRRRRFVLV